MEEYFSDSFPSFDRLTNEIPSLYFLEASLSDLDLIISPKAQDLFRNNIYIYIFFIILFPTDKREITNIN